MEEKELKTSLGQRIGIILIAVIMVGSIIASYVAIVANGGNNTGNTDATKITDEKLLEYETAYADKVTEFQGVTSGDYSKYSQYISRVKAYDEESANNGGIVKKDLLMRNLTEILKNLENFAKKQALKMYFVNIFWNLMTKNFT